MQQHKLIIARLSVLKAMPSVRFLSVLCLLFSVAILRGQTLYIGPDNGDWLTAANWSNGLPATGNNATVSGGRTVDINGTLAIDYTVENFGTIINKGATTVSGNISSGGAFSNEAGASLTVASGGSVLVAGGFTNAGTVTNRGTVTVNTNPLSNSAIAVINNEATWNQFIAFTNNGVVSNKSGVFTCPQLFTNNKTVENLTGARWTVDFGGSFINATGSTLTNAGTFQNLSTFENNTTVTNTGTIQNNGVHTCNGVLNNNNGGRIESTATINLSGRINNNAGATLESSFRFNVLANGFVSSTGAFVNRDLIDVKADGSFVLETGSTLTGQFGSSILNAGLLRIGANATVTTNGSLANSNRAEILGTYDAQVGSQINNTDTLEVIGLVKAANSISNAGVWINRGTTQNNSGSVWTNTGRIENVLGARIENNFDIINRSAGSIVNNGTLFNGVRLTNEGSILNNAYFVTVAEVFNKPGATFNNTEVFFISEGSLTNESTFTNGKTTLISSCAVLSNKAGATVANNGRIESQGILLQRGTWSGNAVVVNGGFTQTSPASSAPSLCKTSVRAGTDIGGNAKVDAAAVVTTGSGLDSCLNIGYFVGGVARITYKCADVGKTFTGIPVKLLLRTGDSLTCTTSVEVFDGVGPVFTNCPKDATVFSVTDSAAYTWQTVTATDNCSQNVNITSTKASGSLFPVGTTNVTVSARDTFNNVNDCMFKVNVQRVFTNPTCPTTDNTAPVFTNCPANQTLSTLNGSVAATWNTPSVSDDCYPIVLQQNFNSGSLFQVGTTTVTYTARDSKNNVSTCSFDITVNGAADICATGTDAIKPVIRNCPPNFFGVVNNAINGAVGVWRTPSANDNCGFVNLAPNFVSGTVFPVGSTPVTYTATDARGNTSTCTFNVLVAGASPCPGDVTAPTLTCPSNVTVTTQTNTATATWANPTASDACAPVTINATHTPGSVFPLGTTVVNYYASDRVGNQSACGFNVTVVNSCLGDTVRPTISNCPANITVVSTNGTSATATWSTPSVSDNCGTATLTSNFQSGATFGIGTTTVVYTATDARGNQNTCSFNVTVNRSNVATCAGNIIVNPSFENGLTDWFVQDVTKVSTVSDPASGAFAARINGDATAILSRRTAVIGGTYTFNLSAKIAGAPSAATVGVEFFDANGAVISTATVVRNVTTSAYANISWTASAPAAAREFAIVIRKGTGGSLTVDDVCVTNPCTNDVTAPTITNCPSNQTINITGTANTATATWTEPTITDNCGTPAVVKNFSPGQSFPVGTTRVVYRATDARGNRDSCVFTITVVNPCANDVTAPSFGTTCPPNQTGVSTNGLCVPVNFTAPRATDNCGTPSVSTTHAPDFCFPIGTTNVVYTAVDAKNNQTRCTFSVTITNQTAPPSTCSGGLKGTYFNNMTLSGTPVLTRTDATVNFQWGEGSPAAVVNANNFSARWEGQIEAPVTGTYTFFSTADDGIRLFINNQTVIDKWIDQAPTEWSGTISLVAGQKYPIKMEYYENGGGAVATLSWSYTGQAKQVVPSTRLCENTPQPVSCAGNVISNFSFESDFAGYLVRNATISNVARSGAKAAKIGTAEGSVAYNFPVNTGGRVSFTSHNRIDAATTSAQVSLTFFDSKGTKVGDSHVIQIPTTTFTPNMINVPVPLGAVSATACAMKKGTTGNFFTDDWCLIVTEPTDLFKPNPNSCYRLVNKVSGKVIDISGASLADGAPVIQWDYAAGQNQKFKFVTATSGGNYFSIRAVHSSLPLDLAFNTVDNEGAYCVQRTFDGTDSQTFSVQSAGGGYYYLVSKNSSKGLMLETTPGTNGTRLIQSTLGAAKEQQKWQIQEVPCSNVCINSGSIFVERWQNHTDWRFPLVVPTGTPTVTVTQGNTQGPWHIGDNYFTRVRGYIKPQTTGNYAFNVTGDDHTELFLSTNSSATSMRRIAFIQGWTNETEYHKYASQTASNIALEAGKLYYFELRHKEGGGGDGWRISWNPQNATNNWQPIQSQFLARPCNSSNNDARVQDVFTFVAKADYNATKLQWVSNTGFRDDYFEVQRSADDATYETLSRVNTKSVDNLTQTYDLTDYSPLEGDNFYRIKTIRMDGTPQYSTVQRVHFKGLGGLNVFPNPANDYFDVDLSAYAGKSVTVTLYNVIGAPVKTLKVDNVAALPVRLDTENLATGTYLVRIHTAGKRDVLKQLKIVK